MFSKLTSSFQVVQSPKQLLANYLSKSVAEFFDVNPADVETNLLTDAKVALHNINIKKRRLGDSGGLLELHGSVKLIEFSWSWGTSAQNLITDVKLTIEGVEVHVVEDGGRGCTVDDEQQHQQQQQSINTSAAGPVPETPGGGGGENWKTRYLNQIIDCLTLVVKDVTIAIHMKDNNNGNRDDDDDDSNSIIYVQGKDMEIHTTHRHQQQKTTTSSDIGGGQSSSSSSCLTQRLQMLSIEAWITTTAAAAVVADDTTAIKEEEEEKNRVIKQGRYQILDPFSYSATVQRVSGRRFVDGIMSGLFIQGDNEYCGTSSSIDVDDEGGQKDRATPSSTIRVHAGSKQIAGLIRLQEILLSLGGESTTAAEAENFSNKSDDHGNNDYDEKKDCDNPSPSNSTDVLPSTSATETETETLVINNSIFSLPIRSMEVVLQNQTSIKLAGCMIRYCTDGTEFWIDCTEGIWMNDDLPLSQNNRWLLDMVACELLLDSSSTKEDTFFESKSCVSSATDGGSDGVDHVDDDDEYREDFRLNMSLDMFGKLYTGMLAVMPQCNQAMELVETIMEQNQSNIPSPAASISAHWTIKVNGNVTFRFSGRDSSSWLEVSADSPKLTQGSTETTNTVPWNFDCELIRISTDASSIDIPKITTMADGKVHVKEPLEVNIGSMESIVTLQRLANDVSKILYSDGNVDGGSTELPFDLLIPIMNLSIMGHAEDIVVKVQEIQAKRSICRFSQIEATANDGIAAHARGIQMSLEDMGRISIQVDAIQQLTIQNINCLAAPLLDTTVSIGEGALDFRFKSLSINSLEKLMNLKSRHASGEDQIDFDWALKIVAGCEDLTVALDDDESNRIRLEGAECIVHTQQSVQFRCKSICAHRIVEKNDMAFSCSKVQAKAIFTLEGSQFGKDVRVEVPGMGALSSASLRIGEISKACIPKIGHLFKPMTDLSISLEEKVSLNAKSFHWRCSDIMMQTTQEGSSEDSKKAGPVMPHLPIDVQTSFDIFSISLDERTTIGLQGFNCLVGVSNEGPAQLQRLQIYCKSITAKQDAETKLSCSDVQAQAQLLAESDKNESEYPFGIPGVGCIPSASLRIGAISELVVDAVGHLAKPSADITVELKNANVTVQLNTVLIQYPDMFTLVGEAKEYTPQNQKTPLPLPLPPGISIDAAIQRLMLMPEFGAGKPGVCFDSVRVLLIDQEAPGSLKLSSSCNYFQGRGPIEHSLGVAKGLKIEAMLLNSQLQTAVASIDEVTSLKVPGVVELTKPLSQLKLLLRDEVFEVSCTEIDLMPLVTVSAPAEGDFIEGASSASQYLQLPLSLRIKTQKLFVHASGDRFGLQDPMVKFIGDQIQIELFSTSTTDVGNISMRMESGAMQVRSDSFSVALERTKVCAKWVQTTSSLAVNESLVQLLSTSQLGILSFASVEIDEVRELSCNGIGSLTAPLYKSKCTFQDDTVSCTLDRVHARTIIPNSSAPASDSKPSFELPVALFKVKYHLSLNSLKIDLDSESRVRQNIAFQSARIDFRPTSTQPCQNELLLCSDTIESQNMFGVSFVSKGLALQAWSTHEIGDGVHVRLPSDLYVEKATLKFNTITSLAVQEVGALLGELEGPNVAYGKEGLSVDVKGDVEWVMLDSIGSSVQGANGHDAIGVPLAISTPLGSEQTIFESIPFPVKLMLNTMKIINHQDSLAFGCKAIEVLIDPDPFDKRSTHTSLKCGVVKAETQDIVDVVAKEAVLNVTLVSNETDGSSHQIYIPAVGFVTSANFHIQEVSSFCVPGVGKLMKPISNLSGRCNGNEIELVCEAVVARRDLVIVRHVHHNTNPQTQTSLPCNVSMSIERVIFEDVSPKSGQVCSKVTCNDVTCNMEPSLAKVKANHREGSGAAVYIRCKGIENADTYSITRVPDVSASGLIQFGCSNTVGNLVIGCGTAELAADFSKWMKSESDTESPSQWDLPFAMVKAFDLNLKCTGPLVNVSDAKIACEAFKGDSRNTLLTLQSHYIGIVKRRIPYLMTKADIAGSNIGDTVSVVASTVAMNSSIVGATAGIAARDAVGSAISMGKSSRGASSSESYKFGDLSRGLVASVKGAATKGSSMRGSDTYAFGDFSAGVVGASGEYVAKNSKRLAGAGGSAAGMAAGFAVAGPIGLVAGSFLGGSAAKSIVPEKKISAEPSDAGSGVRTDTSHPLAVQGQAPDLLNQMNNSGLDTRRSITPQATSAQATWIGDVAASSQPAVMVQAHVLDPYGAPADSSHTPQSQAHPLSNIHGGTRPASVPSQHMHAGPTQGPPIPVGQAYATQSSSQYNQARNVAQAGPSPHIAYASNQAPPPNVPYATGQQAERPQYESTSARRPEPNANTTSGRTSQHQGQPRDGEGYRFGDVTRGIFARGRRVDGRDDNSGYKFGDFTKGLFR